MNAVNWMNQVNQRNQVNPVNQRNQMKGVRGEEAVRPTSRCTIVRVDAGRRKGFSPACGAGLAGYQRGGGGAVSPSARRASRSRKRR